MKSEQNLWMSQHNIYTHSANQYIHSYIRLAIMVNDCYYYYYKFHIFLIFTNSLGLFILWGNIIVHVSIISTIIEISMCCQFKMHVSHMLPSAIYFSFFCRYLSLWRWLCIRCFSIAIPIYNACHCIPDLRMGPFFQLLGRFWTCMCKW